MDFKIQNGDIRSSFVSYERFSEEISPYKTSLNQKKSEIDVIYEHYEKKWETYTSWYEPSQHIKNELQGVDGIPKNASNAFFKAVELFREFVPKDIPKEHIRLFDNASFPGDFIRAFEHLYKSKNWRANSLLSDTALGDRYFLYKNYPEKWMMNKHMNGDVCIPANIKRIKQQLTEEKWVPNVYTSDLGFQVSDYLKQEEEIFSAHLGQVKLGLNILDNGGIFIVKTFTMFEVYTHKLLLQIIPKFKSFHIFKPVTSKPDNSECYWVGVGYDKSSNGKEVVDEEFILSSEDIPEIISKAISDAVKEAIKTLSITQTRKISENIQKFQTQIQTQNAKGDRSGNSLFAIIKEEKKRFQDTINSWEKKYLSV